MLARQRQDVILRHLALRGSVRTTDLVETLGASEVTVRRDLAALVRAGLATRVHGGAIAAARHENRRSTTLPLGIVVPSSTVYFPAVVKGAEDAARRLGVRLVLAVTDYDATRERSALARMLALGVQGILLTNATADTDPHSELEVPTVIVERPASESANGAPRDRVGTDHDFGAGLALAHLLRLGHTRVVFALRQDTPTAQGLLHGWATARADRGLDPEPTIALPGHADTAETDLALHGVLDHCASTGATAVFMHPDGLAARLLELALDRGLRIPQDLAVVSYDDEVAALAAVPLTAVSPPKRALGETAVRILTERIADPGLAVHDLRLRPRLVVRDSSGPDDRV